MRSVRRIVVFRSDFTDQEKQLAFLRQHGARIVRVLGIVNAIAVEIPHRAEEILSRAPEVAGIDIDERVVEAL